MPGVFGETSYRFRKVLWLWQCGVATTVGTKGQQIIVLRHPTGQLEFCAATSTYILGLFLAGFSALFHPPTRAV